MFKVLKLLSTVKLKVSSLLTFALFAIFRPLCKCFCRWCFCSAMLNNDQSAFNLWIIQMTIMCPVPRTTTTHNDLNDSSINPYNIYNEYEETSAYSLSQVSVDASLKLVNLPANCRNISDEVFPGLHLGDRWIDFDPNAGLAKILLTSSVGSGWKLVQVCSLLFIS